MGSGDRSGPPRLLLTGVPGIGKTTVVRRVVEVFPDARGFVTEEIRGPEGRTGFGLSLLDGRSGILAGVSIRSRLRVGRYRVDLSFLEEAALPEIEDGIRRGRLVVIDEIGKMECLSSLFVDAVRKAFASSQPILGTIPIRGGPIVGEIRNLRGVETWTVTRENRDGLVERVVNYLRR